MRDKLFSIFYGSLGSVITGGAIGILSDIFLTILIAFLGGIFGYLGNKAAKYFEKKFGKNASKQQK